MKRRARGRVLEGSRGPKTAPNTAPAALEDVLPDVSGGAKPPKKPRGKR